MRNTLLLLLLVGLISIACTGPTQDSRPPETAGNTKAEPPIKEEPMPIPQQIEEKSPEALVKEALGIIDRNLEISENLHIRSTGSEGEMMKAYQLLKQASDLDPDNLQLRYASLCGLRLAAQFASSLKEMRTFVKGSPDFTLGKFTLDGWEEDAEGIAPAMFRYPECTPAMLKMPPFYARFVKTFVLLPDR